MVRQRSHHTMALAHLVRPVRERPRSAAQKVAEGVVLLWTPDVPQRSRTGGIRISAPVLFTVHHDVEGVAHVLVQRSDYAATLAVPLRSATAVVRFRSVHMTTTSTMATSPTPCRHIRLGTCQEATRKSVGGVFFSYAAILLFFSHIRSCAPKSVMFAHAGRRLARLSGASRDLEYHGMGRDSWKCLYCSGSTSRKATSCGQSTTREVGAPASSSPERTR